MNVVRSLERRLERLLEGVAGRVFSGRIHPSELAGKLAREADFARFQHFTGPATANLFVIQANPDDLSVETSKLEEMLAAEMTAYTTEEGLRLEGPITVRIEPLAGATSGKVNCHVEVAPGPPVVWARLIANGETLEIGRNRATIGRSSESDVVVPHDDVSRRHALIYRQHGQAWLRDLSSANGTTVDGVHIGNEAVLVQDGSVIGLSEHRYRFLES
ncbi:MAG TPA: FhaA domain-containing protein [Acidimicrobiia bacterium]